MHESSVTVDNDALLKFANNSAENGGAISLYGSWITVSNNSHLVFINNTVTGFGGAIYVYMTEEAYLPYSHHCFIKSTVNMETHGTGLHNLYLNEINTHIIYQMIFMQPPYFHVWKRKNLSLYKGVRETFCNWNGWKFGGTCSQLITTSPRSFSSTLNNTTLYPGFPSEHLIYAEDDLGHNVKSFFVYPTV